MKILEVEADNFLSLNHVTIPFQDQGLVCIKGENFDSPGMDSNGSGKSSLYEIFPWTIWGKLIRGSSSVDDVVNRVREERGCFGRVKFMVNGEEYEVLRARDHAEYGTKLELKAPDKTYDGNKRAVQEEIERIMPMDQDLFSSTSYFGQGDFKRFSELTDSQRKDVFRNLLFLHRFEEYRDLAKQKREEIEEERKELEEDRHSEEVRLDSVELDIEELEDRVEELQQEVDEIHKERKGLEEEVDEKVGDLREEIGSLESDLSDLEDRESKLEEKKDRLADEINDLQGEIDERRQSLKDKRETMNEDVENQQESLREDIEEKQEKKQDLKDKKSEVQSDIKEARTKKESEKDKVEKLEERIRDAKDEIESVEDDLESLDETDTCPTCGQALQSEADLSGHREELEQKLERYKDKRDELVENLEQAKTNIHALEDAIEESEETVEEYDQKITEVDQEITNLKSEQERVREEVQSNYDLEGIEIEIEEYEEQKREKEQEREQVEENLRDVMKEHSEIQTQIDNKRHEIEKQENRISELDNRIEQKESNLGTYEEDLREKEDKRNELQDEIDELTEQIEECNEQYQVYNFWVDGFGPEEIQSILLDSVVPFLNDRAQHYSELICDGSYQIDFRTRVPYKSKDGYKDDFSIKIQTEGQEPADYSIFSGGEKQRIDICIMMALHDLSQSVTGRSLDCVIYDEFFSRVDDVGSQRLGEMLVEQKAQKSSIFVVTHNKDLFQSGIFDQIWTVQKEDGLSTLEKG